MSQLPMNNPPVTAFDIPGYNPGQIGLPTGAPVFDVNGNPTVTMPNMGGGLGSLNFAQKAGLGLQGISTVAGLIMGLKQLSLANKQFNFQKQFATTNLANQVKSYNTALSDRLRSRSVMETGSTAGSDAQIAANSLKTSY